MLGNIINFKKFIESLEKTRFTWYMGFCSQKVPVPVQVTSVICVGILVGL